MIEQLINLLPDSLNRIPVAVALAIAGFGLFIALIGGRFSRAIIALSLVSAGTVAGLQMPRWFGWGVDPMGTAFAAAIVLGISGYVLTALWEGILLATLFAAAAGLAVWLKLAPQSTWHLPIIDYSATALEIAGKVRLSLPSPLTTTLPVALGIGATVGALIMVIWSRLGRVLFYAILGLSLSVVSAILAIRQLQPAWLMQIPKDPWMQGAIFGGMIIFAIGLQWLLLPRSRRGKAATSDNNPAVGKGAARRESRRVQSVEQRMPVVQPLLAAGRLRPHKLPTLAK